MAVGNTALTTFDEEGKCCEHMTFNKSAPKVKLVSGVMFLKILRSRKKLVFLSRSSREVDVEH
jgi:hypothetical protein